MRSRAGYPAIVALLIASVVSGGVETPSCPRGEGWIWEAVTLAPGQTARRGDPSLVTRSRGAGGGGRHAHLALILDASGSMRAELAGTGRSRLAVAKEVLAKLVPEIPSEVTTSLWIYGHRHPQQPREASCRDIEQVIPPGPVDAAAYMARIDAVQAIGYTPIAESLRRAAGVLPPGRSNSIVLVSDGEETCGGDPCALAEGLKAAEASVTVHVVAYAVKEAEREQLRCIARVSGGTYQDAEEPAALLEALRQATGAALAETVLRVELVGPGGAEVREDVDVTEAGVSGKPSRMRAWTSNAVLPGKVDLVVRTLPAILYEGLDLEEGTTTTVRIPLGAVHVLTPEREDARFDLHDAGAGRRLGQYSWRLVVAPGCYRIGVVGMGDPFLVDPGETEEIVLATIRVLTHGGGAARFGLLDGYTGKSLGQWNGAVPVIPGRYGVEVVLPGEAFRLASGETREVLLGAVRVETPEGGDARFSLKDGGTGRWLGQWNGTMDVMPPGPYIVSAMVDGVPFSVDAGELKRVVLGSIHVEGPDGGGARFSLHDGGTGKWLAQGNGTIALLPGSYSVSVVTMGEPFDLEAGGRKTVRLGTIHVPGGFGLYDTEGKWLGGYKNTQLLMPGVYRVEVDGGAAFDRVEVKAGEVAAPR